MKAVEMALKQRKVAEDFSTTFPNKTVDQWKRMVEDWQVDHSLPNPYVSNEQGMFFISHLVAVSYGYSPSVETL